MVPVSGVAIEVVFGAIEPFVICQRVVQVKEKMKPTTKLTLTRKPLLAALACGAVAGLAVQQPTLAQNAPNTYTGSGTGNITTGSNWSLAHVPTVSEDAVFASTSNTGIKNFGTGAAVGAPVTVGSVDVTAAAGSYSIRNATTSANDAFLTLGGAGNLGNAVSGTPSDLLFAATGSTLQLLGDNPNGTGVLRVVLGQSGSFDAAGTINITAAISDGVNSYAVTKSGAGTLQLANANAFDGGVTLSAGTLQINNASALGTGTFNIAGGTITNTSAADIVLAANNPQTWSGDFTFSGNAGSKNLDLGTGAVTLTSSRQVNVTGTTSTLTVSGPIGDGGGGFGLTRGGAGTGTLILVGSNTYTGNTSVSTGALKLSTAGTNNIATSPKITVSNNAVLNVVDVGGANANHFALASGQTLAGVGTVQGNVAVASGSIISPADLGTRGTLTTGGESWLSGGKYIVDVTAANPNSAGNHDLLSITDGTDPDLTFPASGLFTIKVVVAGGSLAPNQYFTIASSATGTTTALDPTKFTFVDQNDSPAAYDIQVIPFGGGSGFQVQIAAAPEPTTTFFFGTGAAALTLGRWRRRRRGAAVSVLGMLMGRRRASAALD